MSDSTGEPVERPATWENVVVGKAKEVLGHLTGDERLAEEGEEQEEVAREVHEAYDEERSGRHRRDEP